MLDNFLHNIANMGSWAYVFVFIFAFCESITVIGLFVPGATFIVLFGFLIAERLFDFGDALLFAAFGAMMGDVFSFVLGRRGIDPAKRFPKLFAQSTIDRAEKFMTDYGVAGVFLGRFIGPLRPFVPFMAGALKMSWKSFMAMNVVSGFLWAGSYLAVGYFFGQFWQSIHRGIRWVGIGMFVIIASYLLVRYIGYRRRKALKIDVDVRIPME